MSSSTARLRLVKPAGSEAQDVAVINSDLDLLDKFAGAILVGNGVTPADADLFDGAIVKERVSGLVWVAQWNGTSYDKKFINGAFMELLGTGGGVGNNAWVLQGVPTNNASRGDLTAMGASLGIIVARTARYTVECSTTWNGNVTGDRGVGFTFDPGGTNAIARRIVIPAPSASNAASMTFVTTLSIPAATNVGLIVYQSSGASLVTAANRLSISEVA